MCFIYFFLHFQYFIEHPKLFKKGDWVTSLFTFHFLVPCPPHPCVCVYACAHACVCVCMCVQKFSLICAGVGPEVSACYPPLCSLHITTIKAIIIITVLEPLSCMVSPSTWGSRVRSSCLHSRYFIHSAQPSHLDWFEPIGTSLDQSKPV